MTDTPSIEATVHALTRKGLEEATGTPEVTAAPDPTWSAVRAAGTSLWLDTGDIEVAGTLWNAEFEALTTNNTLLNREVQKGLYDDLVGEAASAIRAVAPDIDDRTLLLEIAFVLNARHGLTLVQRFGAFVSVELHTDLANDVERTVAYGRRFFAVCPERFYVKVPLSPAGLIGARRLSSEGIPINFTLGFSARQNVLSALVAQPSFVNVFMGRLNAFVADNELGDGKNVGEKATLATQRELLALREAGRAKTRLIGASMRDGTQVGTLAGLDVYTMPPKVAAQYKDNPLPEVTSRVGDDPEVTTSPGVTYDDMAASTLWDVAPEFRSCAVEMSQIDPNKLTPEEIVDRLAQAGFGDLFPRWSKEDTATAATDGKIPVYEHWKERLAGGEVGLDALMNWSAYHSFVADEAALDERVTAHLG
ncbi:MAG: transaldolase [Lentisphaerae bacterium]|nr:transaldolase [Lentisphaerota bacterium]